MTDKPLTDPPIAPKNFEAASGIAPMIYFDLVPNFGYHNGVANMTLEAILHVTDDTGKPVVKRAVVAHLRMAAHGLANLKSAIEGIELLAKPVENSQAN